MVEPPRLSDIEFANAEFQGWLKTLDAFASDCGNKDYVKSTGDDCWRGYFDDGYSPEEAYYEDASYD